MSLSFVNQHGDAITYTKMDAMRAAGVEAERAHRAANKSTERTHKGWRVVGIPLGLLEKAQAEHAPLLKVPAKQACPATSLSMNLNGCASSAAWPCEARPTCCAKQQLNPRS